MNIKNFFLELPVPKKIVLMGSILTIVSMFMPVYSELSKWGKPIVYYGITGPMKWVGFSIIVFSFLPIVILLLPFSPFKNKKISLTLKNASIFASIQSLFLLLITSSIYLSVDFGVDLSIKEISFGMFLGLLGAVLNLFGGILVNNEKLTEKIFQTDEDKAPFLMPKDIQERMHSTLDYLKTTDEAKKIMEERKKYNLKMNI